MASVVIIKNIFSSVLVFFEDAVLLIEPTGHLHTAMGLARKNPPSRLYYDTKYMHLASKRLV